MQRLRWVSQGCADHVPDLSRDRRGNHVHPRPRKCDPESAAMAREWARFTRIGRIGCSTQQLSLLQRLYAGVPIKCEPGAAKSGIALRRPSKIWDGPARTHPQPAGYSGANWLWHATAGECGSRIRAAAHFDGKNRWPFGETYIAKIRRRTFRSLV